jgi:hypothetical protein
MGIVDSFKDVLKVAETVNNIELYKKLSELQTRVMEVEEENRCLKDELARVKEQSRVTGQLRVRDNAYWLVNEGKDDGPFCMTCWDVDRKLVRQTSQPGLAGGFWFFCAYCKGIRGFAAEHKR